MCVCLFRDTLPLSGLIKPREVEISVWNLPDNSIVSLLLCYRGSGVIITWLI